jgi:flagellar biosynthesis protein FlhF
MKIKHYRATDMRQALRMVREAQGPDAVILSSKRLEGGGVEVVAAVDFDAEVTPEESYTRAPQNLPREERIEERYARTERPAARAANEVPRWERSDEGYGRAERPSAPATRAVESDAAWSTAALQSSADMNEELRTLRQMLETQLATLAWNDLSRRSPLQVELLKQLTVLGLAHDLAGELVAQLPSKLELAEAHRLSLAMLARRIEVVEERWIEQGGVIALVGPTGVGKTTLIAKLAARWVMRHGPRSLAVISADSVRIGAQEQIQTLGRLLGAPAYAIEGASELPELLDHLADRRLILIDTAGLSQRDTRLASELETLAAAHPRLEVSLVLSAAAQAGSIEETVQRFAPARPSCCVLTKLDEATSLGGAISMLIRSRMPVAYVSEGQRVPEDLSAARAHQLIARAVELSRRAGATADEDLLQRRFGSVAHALA